MATECPYCTTSITQQCPSVLRENREFHCTRPRDHDGPHVACPAWEGRHQIRTWRPTMDDIARDLVKHTAEQRATIARAREHLDKYARRPHDEHCDGDNPCPRDLAEEVLAILHT